MEFEILNQQEFEALPEVRWNFEDIKKYALEKAQEYKSIAYTEDDAKAMKSDRADINRFIGAIEDERKKKKKEMLKPYEAFEAQVKEVLAPLREAEALISKGLKEIDDKWKAERKEKIREIYEAKKEGLGDVVPFEAVLCEAQFKKSISLKAVDESIGNLFDRVKTEVEEIERLPEKYQPVALRAYKASSFNLAAAFAEVRQIQQDEKEIEERKRKAAEQDEKARAIRDDYRRAVEAEDAEKTEEPILQLDFRVYGTREQILALRDYMVATGIRFGRLGDGSK